MTYRASSHSKRMRDFLAYRPVTMVTHTPRPDISNAAEPRARHSFDTAARRLLRQSRPRSRSVRDAPRGHHMPTSKDRGRYDLRIAEERSPAQACPIRSNRHPTPLTATARTRGMLARAGLESPGSCTPHLRPGVGPPSTIDANTGRAVRRTSRDALARMVRAAKPWPRHTVGVTRRAQRGRADTRSAAGSGRGGRRRRVAP